MIINQPTRITRQSSTCIDYMCTNFYNSVHPVCKVLNDGISDHTSQILEFDISTAINSDCEYRYTRLYNDINYTNFFNHMNNESWNEIYNAITAEEGFTNFINTLIYYNNLCFPLTKINIHKTHRNKGWITPGIRVSSEKLKILHQIRSQTNDPAVITFYKKYKKIYKKVILSAKKLHNDLTYLHSNNKSKTVWSIINNTLANKQTKNVIEHIKIENNLIDNPYIIAQHLNKYFIDLPVKLNKKLDENLKNNFTPLKQYPTLFLEPVTESEIFNIIIN